MFMFLTSIAVDISLGIAWWVTKNIVYQTVSLITPSMLT